jgi:glycosyltransferase involved in cell wall biosynthesis
MIVAICFTNFGPYHLARLRALADRLHLQGDYLIAYEVAAGERTYPWTRQAQPEAFERTTLFPDRTLESLTSTECSSALVRALDYHQPDVLGVVGYARPESMAAACWGHRHERLTILMSESQALDHPRIWWKEVIKTRRVRRFGAALVGGPRHRDYLISLGMSARRIALGYDAVDNRFYQDRADAWRKSAQLPKELPQSPYFLSVCRFVPEKNLIRLISAFARYRARVEYSKRWDLVLCGDGPQAGEIDSLIIQSGCAGAIHRPGFLQADILSCWYAHAAAFILPSISEPWGLVVNEAASTGLPLLVSDRCGCAPTLVPDPEGTTGARFDPFDVEHIALKLSWMSGIPIAERQAMGQRAATTVSQWGPERFAEGFLEALELAGHSYSTPMRLPRERVRQINVHI